MEEIQSACKVVAFRQQIVWGKTDGSFHVVVEDIVWSGEKQVEIPAICPR
jgi:hypothetical protein